MEAWAEGWTTDGDYRMQSISARSEYKNSFHCGYRIVKEEGVRALWSGAMPRLVRLMLSGGIVFTMLVVSILILNGILTTVGTRRAWTCSTR